MARSSTQDPLEKFRFLVDFVIPDGSLTGETPVRCGFHDIQMPKRATNKIMYREGHDPDINGVSAGLNTMEDIVMSRGVIAADGAQAGDFYKWISAIHKPTAGITGYGNGEGVASSATGSNDYRAEVSIRMLDREGTIVRAWKMYQAFPVNFVPGSDLNAAEDGEKSMEALTLGYEDFQELAVADGVVGEAFA